MNDNHNCLFVGKLENDHESWYKYLRLPKAFLPLVKYICEINKISFDENYEMVTMSMLLRWFSGVSIRWLAEKIDYDFNRITNVKALKAMLIKLLDKVK